MVRRLVGVLAHVGRGELAPAAVRDHAGADTGLAARLTAPASGLFLERVFYEPPPPSWPLVPAGFGVASSSLVPEPADRHGH
jgi:tRNA pseudouridine38-40 synthase